MKKMLMAALILMAVLMTASFAEAKEVPSMELSYLPELDSFEAVRGTVNSLEPGDYRVTLYVQIEDGGRMWIKPTWEEPFVEVESDGSFAIPYATGGEDYAAKYLHVFLIPSSFTPGDDFDLTLQAALDYWMVTRVEGEEPFAEQMMRKDASTVKGTICLNEIPVYGCAEPFTGHVVLPEGADNTQFRVTLYLQLSADGQYWVKPTYDNPFVTIDEDGFFSLPYVTGGSDEEATNIHIFLIPADYFPDSDFQATKNASLDYVQVTRAADGTVHIDPAHD